jgi:hypothetical protein
MKTLLLGLLVVLGSAGLASAQSAQTKGQLDLEYKQRSPALQPVPPRKVEEDTNQALRELDRQRTDEAIRKAQPAPSRRPDLDRDVTQGIQSRGLSGR